MLSLCNNWEFSEKWSGAFLNGEGEGISVRLPHTVREIPLHYASPKYYEMLCGYRRKLDIPESYKGKRLFLQFDGAAHIATVYINGMECAHHRSGYTAFRAEITELVNYGGENLVAVKLDCSENVEIPPFGFVIDYLTYGGLYREAWLDVREREYIEDVYITTPDLNTANVKVRGGEGKVKISILDGDKLLASIEGRDANIWIKDVQPWSCDNPKLYTCRVELGDDVREESFGFRTAEFKADGFYLNGEKTFIRGLNRHQNYPYIGYAAPESLQRMDAKILKHELACNAVRTSHYPQSKHFIDECDRLGLLVFTEIPGWQHIGDEKWKEQALENVREMVMQYRNHPSIILWGVRINESVDDDELYKRTNALCRKLDPSRQTSGVRYLEKSSLLEDVYAYNDFSHTGNNPGVKSKKAVTPDMNKALLVSECNGHMFPTKPFDPWQKRQEHALRHARVQNDSLADGEHAGCYAWCMFDYPTHKDFGSGDRVCYHGVMDAFRNPKLAAALYASQGDEIPVLEVGSPMDIGDYPGGQTGEVYVFTNADEVRLYKNDKFVKSFKSSGWALKHGPVLVDDTIGELLESVEGFEGKKAEILRHCLGSAGKHGLANMPLADKLKMGYAMLKYKMSFADGVALYGKYVGNWGGEATRWHFDGVKDGKVIATQTRCPSDKLRLDVNVSSNELREAASYDMAAIRIRVVDEFGNVAPYAQLPVCLEVVGDIELVGSCIVTAEGGMCGAYVKSSAKAGEGKLIISAEGLESVEIDFTVEVSR